MCCRSKGEKLQVRLGGKSAPCLEMLKYKLDARARNSLGQALPLGEKVGLAIFLTAPLPVALCVFTVCFHPLCPPGRGLNSNEGSGKISLDSQRPSVSVISITKLFTSSLGSLGTLFCYSADSLS